VAGIDIVAPSATLTLDGIALSKSDKANTAIDAADTASQPDGALLKKVSDGAIVDGSYEIACPVAYSDLNQFVAKATLTLPALAQEVLDNTDVTYSVAVLKQGTDLAHGTNDFTLTTTSSPAELTMTVPVDKNGLSGLYNAYVNVNYASTGKYDLTNTDDRASKGVEQEITLDAPTFTLSDSGYAKYEDHNWDGVTYSSLGYFSHVGLQFDITSNGFDYSTVNSYVSFDIPQNACTVDGEGCYATNSTDANGNPMWEHSFAGTRAANGGAPLCFDYSDAIKAIANDGVTYKEYDSSLLTAGQTWADIYDAANNWSLLAARSGRLSVMVNPAYSYADETAYAAGQMSGSLSASLGLIIPVDETPSISIAGTASSKAAGKVLRKAAAITGISSLTSASAEPMTIDLQNVAVVTGISEVEADAATTGDAVYYNLQGIRVEHPPPARSTSCAAAPQQANV